MFAIPFPALVRIKDLKLRLAVCAIYALGTVGLAVSTVRIILMAIDPEKGLNRIIILSSVETSVHIMVATIPGLSGTFIKRYRNRSTNKNSSSGGANVTIGGSYLNGSKQQPARGVVIGVSPQDVELQGSVTGQSSPFGGSTDEIVQKQ